MSNAVGGRIGDEGKFHSNMLIVDTGMRHMQRKSKRRARLFSATAILLLVAGCTRTEPVAEPKPRFEGVGLRVACPAGTPATVLEQYGTPWARREGCSLKVTKYDADPAGVAGADVWVVRPCELPRWAAAGRLQPVPEELRSRESYGWLNLLPLYRDKLGVWDRVGYGLPLLGEGPVCFYRADLLGDADNLDAFAAATKRKLGPPATWEDYAAIAEFFHGRQGFGPGDATLPPLPADDEELDREFYWVAATVARRALSEGEAAGGEREVFSFHYDLATGAPRVDTPGFVHALQLQQRLQALRPAGADVEPPAAFARGEAVLCVADAFWIARFQKSAVRGKFGVCRLPGSGTVYSYSGDQTTAVTGGNFVPYLGAGGWLAVVPRDAPHPEAAWGLLEELSGPEISRQIVIEPAWGGGVCRRDQFAPRDLLSFGLDQAQTSTLAESLRRTLAHLGVKNPVVRLRTPDEAPHRKAMTEEVRAALLKGGDAKKALERAAQRWRELDRDRDTRLADYYLSLSLQPPRS
jgi:multiple sugar transport system substrate-binding protein